MILFIMQFIYCYESEDYPYFLKNSLFPVHIGPEIPIVSRPCYETFYTTTIRISSSIPETGRFPLSLKRNEVYPFTVDDSLRFNSIEIAGGYK